MIYFEPESPWEVGQRVTFRDDNGNIEVMVVSKVEKPEQPGPLLDETQYRFVPESIWPLYQAGVRPYAELD